MKGVYQVKYWELVEERKGERPVGGGAVVVNVVARGAEDAIAKVKKKKVGEKKSWYDDDAEMDQVSTTVEIQIESVVHLASIDF